MAHLTKPVKYDIKDSNIALLGSDLEKRVREHAGDQETAWENAGRKSGLQVWRIEKFKVVVWDRPGSFYDGDAYIVLNTYKKTPDSDALSYDLHFWLGESTSQDEAGTAAYKTVELDDHLHGAPVQYREVQKHESSRFLSYFPHFICLRGGISTGFHHISTPPPPDMHTLYRITMSREEKSHHVNLVIQEVAAEASSLVEGDVFVLDKGDRLWQFNTKSSVGQDKFKAAEFVQRLANDRRGQCDVTVYDEGGPGAGIFLSEFGKDTLPRSNTQLSLDTPSTLFRLSDSTGIATFETIDPPTYSSLSSADAFLLDYSSDSAHPTIYIWVGKEASLNERRLALQYAQRYLYKKQQGVGDHVEAAISIVKMKEGNESSAFLKAIKA